MPKRQLFIVILAAVVCGVWLLMVPAGVPARPHFPKTGLTVIRADGEKISFTVEVARGDADQSYGLMFVRSLAADAGMIFPYAPPRPVAFWMKNTLIPLDMLFVRPDHRIGRIVTNAKPEDVTPISSEMPVSAVIEIGGGEAAGRGIAVDDKIDTDALN